MKKINIAVIFLAVAIVADLPGAEGYLNLAVRTHLDKSAERGWLPIESMMKGPGEYFVLQWAIPGRDVTRLDIHQTAPGQCTIVFRAERKLHTIAGTQEGEIKWANTGQKVLFRSDFVVKGETANLLENVLNSSEPRLFPVGNADEEVDIVELANALESKELGGTVLVHCMKGTRKEKGIRIDVLPGKGLDQLFAILGQEAAAAMSRQMGIDE